MKRPFGALPLFINKPRKAEIIGVITTADFPNISNKSVAIKLDIPELFNISAIIEDERRIYTMFKDEYKPQHLIECIKTAYQEQPAASRQQIIPIIFNLLSADSYSSSDIVKLTSQKSEYLNPNQ